MIDIDNFTLFFHTDFNTSSDSVLWVRDHWEGGRLEPGPASATSCAEHRPLAFSYFTLTQVMRAFRKTI